MENNVENPAPEQPLFQCDMFLTKEEYVRFSRFGLWHLNKMWLISIPFYVIVILTTFVCRLPLMMALIGLIPALISIPLLLVGGDVIAKMAYNSDVAGKTDRLHFLFFHDRITEIREHGSDTYGYEKLLMIKETDKSFYIMVTKSNGMIILKSNCSPELIAFIRSVKSEYKK